MMKALIALLLTSQALALSSLASPSSATIFTNLKTTPLVRASDARSIPLTSQWRQSTPFGIADETAVHAAQLRDVVLPATSSRKLFFVGVGSSIAAQEFATQLNIDPNLCFGDDGGEVGEILGLEKGTKTMWNPPAVKNMMGRNDKESLKAIGEAYKSAADNIGFQKLAPSNMQDTLRQGGTFVFKGDKLLLAHIDQKVGDNCLIDDILKVL